MIDLSGAALAVIFVALALGGILKGATGAGVPVIAVPVIAAFYDVRLAVALIAVPNFFTNCWQLWKFRAHHLSTAFTWVFAASGALGAIVGTVLLATLPAEPLMLLVAISVTGYVALRVMVPEFQLQLAVARRIVWPVGLVAGLLQGAAGISAPVSVSFLNALRLPRPAFIATISAFFAAMTVTQIPTLALAGLMTPMILTLGVVAVLPIFAFMPVGAWLAQRMSQRGFDRLVLSFLSVLALKLFYDALF